MLQAIKKAFCLLIIFLPYISPAQTADTTMLHHIDLAGKELVTYNRIHATGTALEVGGTCVAVFGLVAGSGTNTSLQEIAFISGGVLSLVGTIISLTSHKHIGLAGLELRYASHGLAVPLPIKNRHPVHR